MNSRIFVLLFFIDGISSARILGIVPTPSYSHQIVFQPIWKELSLRGHQVVTITTDLINNPDLVNLTEINLESTYDVWNKHILAMTTADRLSSVSTMFDAYYAIDEHILTHEKVQGLINSDAEHFDLVIAEYSLVTMFAFAQKFKAPLVTIASLEVPTRDLYQAMGNPIHPLLYPSYLIPVNDDLSLIERVYIVLFELFLELTKSSYVEIQNSNIKKYFGDEYSSAVELHANVSLALINTDPIFQKVKPLVPTIVQFGGGAHRIASQPLSKALKKNLDSAQNGFIYFSLGTNAKSTFLGDDTLSVIVEAFAELPYTVLWKFENDDVPNKPKNVITSKWLPQQNVLKHSNIKLFITQGGLQSIEEAMYDYVPMLIMPIFSDQQVNANRMVAKGCALKIDYKTMTKDDLKNAILEVIKNPKYKNRIQQLAALVLDQPMTGLEKAVWWIEYVIRHKGTAHLRSPYVDMPLYQYYYLDIIGVFGLALLIVLSIFVFLFNLSKKCLLNFFYRKVKTE